MNSQQYEMRKQSIIEALNRFDQLAPEYINGNDLKEIDLQLWNSLSSAEEASDSADVPDHIYPIHMTDHESGMSEE